MRPRKKARTMTVNGDARPPSPDRLGTLSLSNGLRFRERPLRRRLRRFCQPDERTLFNRSLSSFSFSFSQSGENEERLRERERAGSAFVPLVAVFRPRCVRQFIQLVARRDDFIGRKKAQKS